MDMSQQTLYLAVCVFLLMVQTQSLITNSDPRCYLKSCEISLAARDNSAIASENLPVMENKIQATVADCASVAQENITTGVQISQEGVLAGIVNLTESTIGNINSIKGELMSEISQRCRPRFHFADLKYIHVELKIFSGVENPKWLLSADDPDFVALKEKLAPATSSTIPTRAGYRGFTVTMEMVDGTTTLQTFGQGQQKSPDLELLLLHTNSVSLDPTLVSIVISGINREELDNLPPVGSLSPYMSPSGATSVCDSGAICEAPQFDPIPWSSEMVSLSNNCYNYAARVATNTRAQPGRGSGNQYYSILGETIRNRAVDDGFTDLDNSALGQLPDTDNCLVALFAVENIDFHFIRQDGDGTWSHKVGTHAPTNMDNKGEIITDPRTADIGPYQFVRFLSYCRTSKIQIK